MKKFKKYIKYYYHRSVKLIILKLFYQGYHTAEHFNLPSATLITIFIFQKIIGLNRHIKFPVHFTNKIGKTGYFDIDLSSTISLAVNGSIYIQTINGVIIGKCTRIASGSKIISANHRKSDLSAHVNECPIMIGDKCWLGANVVILPTVNLGNNVVVGAGSIVTKSFGDKSVIVGNPGRCI